MTRALTLGARCVLAVGLVLAAREARAQLPPGAIVVVLPLEGPQASLRTAWLREGVAELLGDAIDAAGHEVVERDGRVAAFERLQLPVTATLSRASTVRVGQAVGATAVVFGRLDDAGDEVTVTARLIRLDTGTLLPDVVERGPATTLFAIAARVAARLIGTSGSVSEWRPPPSLGAFELYTRGLVSEVPATARSFFEQALKAAPDYDAVRLALWRLHTEQGEHQRALDAVEGIATGRPLDREGRFAAAMSLISLDRAADAFGVLRTMQSGEPLAVVSNALGVVQLRRGASPQTGQATYFFNQATELDPGQADYFFNLGYAYWQEKDANAAVYWLREAVRRNPADDEAHFVLSAALQQSGATAEATRERELAKRLSSRYAPWEARASAGGDLVPRGLERLHARLDMPSARVDTVIGASGQRDQAALAAFHLDAGRRAADREQDAEAERELRRALYLSPYLAEAHLLLGQIYLRSDRVDEAVLALKIAVWSEPSARAHAALGEAYLAEGDVGGARAELGRAVQIDPRAAEVVRLRGKLPPLQFW